MSRGPRWALRAALASVRARVDLRQAQVLGRLPRLYGRCWVDNRGRIEIGDRFCMFGGTVRGEMVVHEHASLEIGDDVFINYGASISAERSVRIASGCHIGQYAIVNDGDQHSIGNLHSRGLAAPVVIGEGAWLGARVMVLKGVTIGAGAVIGAGSVVTRSIPARCVAAGVPARVIRQFD